MDDDDDDDDDDIFDSVPNGSSVNLDEDLLGDKERDDNAKDKHSVPNKNVGH